MPGIEAAVERFNALTGSNGAADAAEPASASGSATADGHPKGWTPNGSTATPSSAKATEGRRETGEPPKGGTPNKADAQPTVNKEPLPHGRGSDVDAQNSETNPDGARAATETIQTVTGAAGNSDKQQRDAQGRYAKAETPTGLRPAPSGTTTRQDAERRSGGPNAEGQEEPPKGGTPSRYAKAQERLEKTWEAVNKRKGELDSQAQAIEQQRLTLERDKAQFEAIRRQAEQQQATPEQAAQAAQARRRDADALRMQARRAEEAGRSDEAQRLNKQADKADALADDLAEYAGQLRQNPPVSMQQRAQQFEQARKQWTVEACNAFPDLAKNGSRLQQVVAQHLNALAKQDPQLLVHPSLIYHVARLADAQTKVADLETVAARVPVLEKETESLRARIKELEAETTPAANGGVSRLGGESRDDYSSLRREAGEVGHLYR